MKMSYITRQSSKGFTLIELLVVIAIIGILSSVVLASLGTARTKGRIAAAQGTLRGIQAAASICLNDGVAVAIPTETNNGGGGVLCTGGGSYSALPAGWTFCDGATGTQSTSNCGDEISGVSGTPATNSTTAFLITAESEADKVYIKCTETGCTKTDEATPN